MIAFTPFSRLPLFIRGAGAPKGYKGATEGEITRGRCLLRGVDEHQMKKQSFAFSVGYIYCFRTYSVYLSLRLPAQILYAGIHLPPQREARALPRQRTDSMRCAAPLSTLFRIPHFAFRILKFPKKKLFFLQNPIDKSLPEDYTMFTTYEYFFICSFQNMLEERNFHGGYSSRTRTYHSAN